MKKFVIKQVDPDNKNDLWLCDLDSGAPRYMWHDLDGHFNRYDVVTEHQIELFKGQFTDDTGSTYRGVLMARPLVKVVPPMNEKELKCLEGFLGQNWDSEHKHFEEEYGYEVDVTDTADEAWWVNRLEENGHTSHALYDMLVVQAWLNTVEKPGE